MHMKAAHTHCCSRVTPKIVYNGKIPNTDTDIAIFQNTDTEYRTDVKKYRQKYRIPIPTSNTDTNTPLVLCVFLFFCLFRRLLQLLYHCESGAVDLMGLKPNPVGPIFLQCFDTVGWVI